MSSDLFLSIEGLEEYLFAYDFEDKNFKSTIPFEDRVKMCNIGVKTFELDTQEIYKPIVYEKK
jgi:hypothetical protein